MGCSSHAYRVDPTDILVTECEFKMGPSSCSTLSNRAMFRVMAFAIGASKLTYGTFWEKLDSGQDPERNGLAIRTPTRGILRICTTNRRSYVYIQEINLGLLVPAKTETH